MVKEKDTWDVDVSAGAIDQYLSFGAGTSGTGRVEQTHELTGHSQARIRCCWKKVKSQENNLSIWPEMKKTTTTHLCLLFFCLFIYYFKWFNLSLWRVLFAHCPEREGKKKTLHRGCISKFNKQEWWNVFRAPLCLIRSALKCSCHLLYSDWAK